ncbi:efflux RND transporter periplasmic adaptor subunit [Mucilaginibacter sp. BJC16-A38]|uniref:efflux RND transporter periplasmic adaptor subunit n=1 Tax=Mucilaginibacter phenanthrenivorans TaxID=1234842 RepID=UPI00215788CC|nr:efflux RND transporter periplasmic adaptor subunit [Mucilaginibacter phenanthrenivorans]MCR8556222.1 efflux RND transporter periplasmic adaptor subunit [Mucilaginibacter phenanthrenivorans]
MKTRDILLTGTVCMLLWSACHTKDKAALNAAPPPTPVNVTEAKKAEAVYYDTYQGTVVALNTVELRSQVTGFITGIFFNEGEIVTKGKPLYEIDRRKFLDAYEQALANLSSAQANLVKSQKDIDRYNMLLKNDAVARQTVDQAEATYASSQSQVAVAKAAVASAKTDLSYATIVAPFTGRIGISQVKLGAQVSPGTTLLNTISSEHPIAVDVVINEQDINRFYGLQKKSTDSTFKLQLSGGITYNQAGKVRAIDRGVNNQTGTIKVRIEFPNQNDVLKDGMSCVLNVLNSESGNRLQIPYKSVSENMGEFFVFVTKDTIALQRKVKLGPHIGTDIVVLSGIEPGDKVITDGFQRLRDSGKITLGIPVQPGAVGKKAKQ